MNLPLGQLLSFLNLITLLVSKGGVRIQAMKTDKGYQITEEDIQATIKYLQANGQPDATREDAIAFLEEHKSLAHLAAHEIVEEEKKEEVKNQES